MCSTMRAWKNGSFDASHQGPRLNMYKSGQTRSILGTSKAQSISKMPYPWVIEAQMQERRKNGLSYFCEEKWHQGHKCLKPKLYLLEGMELPRNDTNELELETEQVTKYAECVLEDCAEVASILIHAIVGTPSPKTMSMTGQLKKRRVIILIDTCNTHNFMDTTVALKCGLLVQKYNPMQVGIANGDMVSSKGKCNAVAI